MDSTEKDGGVQGGVPRALMLSNLVCLEGRSPLVVQC
jgi:hypothetical protein